MNVKKIFAFGVGSALLAFAPQAYGADAKVETDVKLPKQETRTEIRKDGDLTVRTETDREKVRHGNKASGLIGMEVRNQENQKLGEIKDLVLDVNSGKVSYAVLAVGGFLGIGEKLIALPPSALRLSDDHHHLMLDADKARIEAAPGFAATAWPNMNDSEVHRFWRAEATGSPAGSEIRRKSGDGAVDADVNVDRDRKRIQTEIKKDKIYTDADDDKKVEVEVKKD
jgi:hypothetical protein